jgi:hypothetical protein
MRKCHNLKILLWKGSIPPHFGQFLNDRLTNLQHLSVTEGYMTYANLFAYHAPNLECLCTEAESAEECMTPGISDFMEPCVGLTTLTCGQIDNQVIKSYSFRTIKNLESRLPVYSDITSSIELLTTLGQKLESLNISQPDLNEQQLIMVCNNLRRLKSISVRSNPKNMVHLFHLPNLENISWTIRRYEEGNYQPVIFEQLIQSVGRKLRSLTLDHCNLPKPSLWLIAIYCPGLIKLSSFVVETERS